ncbi:MAG: hypothetical protein R2805_12155 [Flavobacterium sp.]|jgi:hypothetical protein|uniref:hypothetical protein n=1 Tax=Flavobacterium sp. TaxID=239 RepID=UPI00352747C3
MKLNIKIKSIYTLDEIPNYWTNQDYVALLAAFGFADGNTIKPENLTEMLFMAIADYEPNEAAQIVLTYKLSNDLNEGQIDQLSNEMLLDKVCEEYPEIHLHKHLFSINQLLYKAFNGKFPNAKASSIQFSVLGNDSNELSKSDILKAFNSGLNESNIIKRLFGEPMTTGAKFPEAESLIWELNTKEDSTFQLITSEYLIDRESFINMEFDGEILNEEE